LIEVLLAAVAGAMILAATYAVFSQAIHLRDSATERTQTARVAARVSEIIRNDLKNGLVSGGEIARTLEGSASGQSSRFPGYLKLTATTGDTTSDEVAGDLEEIEYYIVEDESATQRESGVLVRAVRRNLLSEFPEAATEQRITSGVSSMQLSFFDGQSWLDSWEVTDEDNTTPTGVRVVISRVADPLAKNAPAPIDIMVPWGTVPVVKKP
jgi:hypothetical protein